MDDKVILLYYYHQISLFNQIFTKILTNIWYNCGNEFILRNKLI